jgi:hypothetical protein
VTSDALEERLPDLLERAAPQPPRDLNGASIRRASTSGAVTRVTAAVAYTESNRTHRGRAWRWTAPGVAAMVVIAIAVTWALTAGHHPLHRHHDGAIQRPTGIEALNAQRRAATTAALDRLLAAFSMPSTWRASTRPLSKALALPTDDPTSYLVSRARLWVTTDAADTAMTYVSSHLPSQVTGGNAIEPTADFASAWFTPGGQWSRSTNYAGMAISVIIERLRPGTVGVEIEASAYWLPLRTPAQTIPDSVTGAAVAIRSEISKKIHHGHLNAADARTLAHEINQLTVTYQAPSMCPMPGPSATLTFTSPAGPQTVTVNSNCPSGVFVKPRTHGMQIDLAPGRVFSHLLSTLNLPANFGRR